MGRYRNVVAFWFVLALGSTVFAGTGVVDFDVVSQGLVADGASFGAVGPYEKLTGKAILEIDPDSPHNRLVIDLDKVPRENNGSVHYAADVYILRPAQPEKGNGAVLLEICNRGGKAAVRYFSRGAARTFDPNDLAEFGDGFLLRRGFTLVWIGWQFDVPPQEGILRLHPPVARGSEGPIRGLVRADAVFAEPTEIFPFAHRGHIAYPLSSGEDSQITLTVRDTRLGQRQVIPQEKWRLARRDESGELVAARDSIYLEEGFEPGRIYEVVYTAEDPVVVGLGLTAVRDVALGLKHHPESPVQADRVLAIGISQTGRFLRHYLYQGFNHDENDRIALDGVWAHTAGAGRGSFNHRFGQPSRDAHAFSAFVYPTDIFPFSATQQTDPVTGRTDGLFKRLAGHPSMPKVFFTNTGYEYWGRAAALVHSSIGGEADLELPGNLRVYHFASTQHFVGAFPPRRNGTRHPGNPADFLWILRSLLLELDHWVAAGEVPPTSRIPSLAEGTLVTLDQLAFPKLPGVSAPEKPHQAYRTDYGPRFLEHGIVDFQPPRIGAAFPTLIPAVDSDGNEIDGVRLPEITVPVATYTPWNLRAAELKAESEMADFRGAFLPFALTSSQRLAQEDPRPSLEERYPTRAHYLGLYALATIELVDEGFLLAEDVPGLLRRAEALWTFVNSSSQESEGAVN
ncbi:MAG: hypothetical protein GY906_26355 [bacterium]|nr:hypothetical protein [bacterium]